MRTRGPALKGGSEGVGPEGGVNRGSVGLTNLGLKRLSLVMRAGLFSSSLGKVRGLKGTCEEGEGDP